MATEMQYKMELDTDTTPCGISNLQFNLDRFPHATLKHSHKKRKGSMETRAVLMEIYVEIYRAAQNTGDHFKKTWLSLKGISYLQVIFVLIWMKQTLIWFNLQRHGTGNGLSNIKYTFAERLQLPMSVMHQSMCIFKAGLSNYMMAQQNIKKKYLMYQIPIKMLKQHAIPNSCLHNLKVYSSKGCRKTSQRWIICVANTAIPNIQIFSRRYHYRLWVFASTGEYFYHWHWTVLPKVLQRKWSQDL